MKPGLFALLLTFLAAPALAGPCEDLSAAAALGGTAYPSAAHAGCNLLIRKPVTLVGGSLRSLTIAGTSDVLVQGVNITLTPDGLTTPSTAAVRITKSQRVTIEGGVLRGGLAVAGVDLVADPLAAVAGKSVIGYPAGTAVSVDGSANVSIRGVDVSGFHMGIGASHVDGLTVEGSRIHGLRTTPIRGGSITRLRVVNNRMWGLAPVRSGPSPDHYDFIHPWTNKDDPTPSVGLVIEDNFMDQGDGPAAIVINVEDNGGGGFPDASIRRNVSISSAHQGDRLEHMIGGTVADNLLLQSAGDPKKDAPIIFFAVPYSGWAGTASSGVDVHGNATAGDGLPLGPHPAWLLDLARNGRLR